LFKLQIPTENYADSTMLFFNPPTSTFLAGSTVRESMNFSSLAAVASNCAHICMDILHK
jgi:hypothetical protein